MLEYLESLYANLKEQNGDINEHLDTLKNLASECEIVIEFGVRWMVSIFALAVSDCKKLYAYDINHPAGYDGYKYKHLEDYCKKYKNDFKFFQKDVLNLESIPECDMLFLDTIASYFQCKAELNLFAKNVKKYIVIHDTTLNSDVDEYHPSKEEWIKNYINNEKLKSIINFDDTNSGLTKAIEEFLSTNKEWRLYRKYENNNGLTILKKIN